MTICTRCCKTYKRAWPHTCKCDHKAKTIVVQTELLDVVWKLLERGFKVISTECKTNYMWLDQPYIEKITHIQIEFSELYPEAMLDDLPPDWVSYEYHMVHDDVISNAQYSAISCSERHPISESDDESVVFTKRLMVSNLGCWLEDKSTGGFKAVWRLYGVNVD
jgi:hypothetical protein